MIPYSTHKTFFQHEFHIFGQSLDWLIPAYTTMMFIGILLAILVFQKKVVALKIPFIDRTKGFLICAVTTMIGGRLFYEIWYTDSNLWQIIYKSFLIWQVGSVSVGGFLFCFLTIYLFSKYYKFNFARMLDMLAPSLGLGMFFARMGCFLAGCCHGVITSVPWGIQMDHGIVHPTQIYSSIYNLLIFILLTLLYYSKYNSKKNYGIVFASYAVLYGFSRFMVEFLRFNPKVLFGLALQQVFGLIMIAFGSYFIYKKLFSSSVKE